MSFERYDSAGREQVLFAQEKICQLLEGCPIFEKIKGRFGRLFIIPCGSTLEGTEVRGSADIDFMLIFSMSSYQLISTGDQEFLGISIYGPEREHWKQYGCVNEEGLVNATEMKNLFACLIKETVSLNERYGLISKVRMLEMTGRKTRAL